MRCGCLLVAFGLLYVPLGTARAVEPSALAKARQHYAELSYEKAVKVVRGALQRGGNEPAAVVALYEVAGLSQASLGRPKAAAWFFERLLALSPDYRLSAQTSPKIRGPFAQALASSRARARLAFTHRAPERGRCDQPLHFVVELQTNPLQLAHGVRLVYWLPGATEASELWTAARRGNIVVTVPLQTVSARPGSLRYRLELLDEAENILQRRGTAEAPLTLALVARPRKPQPPPSGPSSRTIAWAGGGLSVALAATTVVLGVFAKRAHDDLEAELATFPASPDRVDDARSRTRSLSIATDVMTGVTVAAAATTVVWAIIAARKERSRERRSSSAARALSIRAGPTALALFFRFD
jgi:hypothetical protein